MTFHPYLNFGGTCKAAFTRYQEIFGGELFVMPMAEIPGEDGASKDLTAHAALTLPDTVLMGSDAMGELPPPHGMYCMWSAKDADEGKRIFDALADGGTVEEPFAPTFFSPGFGTCVDRFGTPWMLVTDQPQP
jgi:PhnB protein